MIPSEVSIALLVLLASTDHVLLHLCLQVLDLVSESSLRVISTRSLMRNVSSLLVRVVRVVSKAFQQHGLLLVICLVLVLSHSSAPDIALIDTL